MIQLRENEKILKIVRQHRSVIAGAISWSILIAGLAAWVFARFDLGTFGYSWEIIAGVMLMTALVILYKIYVWRKNALIITSQRIILHVRQGVFSRTVTELLYRDIYDISFKQVGLLALINCYGKLIIKTPSGSEITFEKVPSPAKVVEMINRVRVGISNETLNSKSQTLNN